MRKLITRRSGHALFKFYSIVYTCFFLVLNGLGYFFPFLQRPLVQKSEQQLRLWQSAPELLMSPTLNAFGEPLSPESDDVLSAPQCFVSGEDDIQRGALKA